MLKAHLTLKLIQDNVHNIRRSQSPQIENERVQSNDSMALPAPTLYGLNPIVIGTWNFQVFVSEGVGEAEEVWTPVRSNSPWTTSSVKRSDSICPKLIPFSFSLWMLVILSLLTESFVRSPMSLSKAVIASPIEGILTPPTKKWLLSAT